MGLLTGLLTWPLAPLHGVWWLAERVQEQAERVYYDPVSIREQIAELDRALAAGEISEQECEQAQEELIGRLLSRGDADG
jgi:cytochrome c-type biogenesis protein CcmI